MAMPQNGATRSPKVPRCICGSGPVPAVPPQAEHQPGVFVVEVDPSEADRIREQARWTVVDFLTDLEDGKIEPRNLAVSDGKKKPGFW